jgi:hypothetical protein
MALDRRTAGVVFITSQLAISDNFAGLQDNALHPTIPSLFEWNLSKTGASKEVLFLKKERKNFCPFLHAAG